MSIDYTKDSQQIAVEHLISLLWERGLNSKKIARTIRHNSPNQKLRRIIWEVAAMKPDNCAMNTWLGFIDGKELSVLDSKIDDENNINTKKLQERAIRMALKKVLNTSFYGERKLHHFASSIGIKLSEELTFKILNDPLKFGKIVRQTISQKHQELFEEAIDSGNHVVSRTYVEHVFKREPAILTKVKYTPKHRFKELESTNLGECASKLAVAVMKYAFARQMDALGNQLNVA